MATIDENGTITPLKAGKVTITVTSKTPFASSKGADCLSTSKKYTVKAQYNDEYAGGVGFKTRKMLRLKEEMLESGRQSTQMKESVNTVQKKQRNI